MPLMSRTRVCMAWPGSAFVFAIDKQQLVATGLRHHKYYRHDNALIAGEPGIVTMMTEDIDCVGFDYVDIIKLKQSDWFSNRLDIKYAVDKSRWSLWANIALTSKITLAVKGHYQLSFIAQGHYKENDLPQLEVGVYNTKGEKLDGEVFCMAESQAFRFDFAVDETQLLFLQMEVTNDLLDDKQKAIFIEPKSIKITRVTLTPGEFPPESIGKVILAAGIRLIT